MIINLDENEVHYLLNLLGDRPWKESNTLIVKVLRQQQGGNGHATQAGRAVSSVEQHPGAVPPRLEAEVEGADYRNSGERSPPRPSKR